MGDPFNQPMGNSVKLGLPTNKRRTVGKSKVPSALTVPGGSHKKVPGIDIVPVLTKPGISEFTQLMD